MSELDKSDCGPEGLPLSVRRYIYRKEDFSQIVDFERERFRRSLHPIKTISNGTYNDENLDALEESEDVSEYVIFSIDKATHDRDFLDPENQPERTFRTTFYQNIQSLVVKMVLHEHEELSIAFELALDTALELMGLGNSYYHYGSTTIQVANGTKEADKAWGPRPQPRGSPRRPSVIAETAITEIPAKLLLDVGQWLDPTYGLANLVLTMKAERWQPKVTIQRWQYNIANSEIENVQTIEITESSEGDVVAVNGGPLLIPFHLFFLRPAEHPGEKDIFIDEQQLKDLAQSIWDVQFSD